jgi:formate-dependent nitrite reductase membrane component NrfD
MASATEARLRAAGAVPDLWLFDGLAHGVDNRVLTVLGDHLARSPDRCTTVQTTVHIITTGVISALLAGIALKLRVFGPGGWPSLLGDLLRPRRGQQL